MGDRQGGSTSSATATAGAPRAKLHFHSCEKESLPAHTNCFWCLSLQSPPSSGKRVDRRSGALSNFNLSQQKRRKHRISTISLALFFISLSFLRFFKELSTSDFPSVLKTDSLTCLRALYHTTVLQIPKWKVNPNCVHLYCTQTRTQWPVVAPEKRGLVPRIFKIAYCAKFVAHLPMLMWDNWPHVLQKCIAFPQPSD